MSLKKNLCIWIFAGTVFVACAEPVFAARNGDFEKTDPSRKLPEGWTVNGENIRLTAMRLTDEKLSLYVEIPAPRKGWNGISQRIGFLRTTNPVPLKVSVMMRCRELASGEILLIAGRGTEILYRERVMFFSGNEPWKMEQGSAVIPTGAEYLIVQIRNHGYGILYIDDLKIEQEQGK